MVHFCAPDGLMLEQRRLPAPLLTVLSREASIFADRSGQGMTLDGEQTFPPAQVSKRMEALRSFFLFVPRAPGPGCRVERSSGPARAGSNHHEQVCLVGAEWDLDRI